MSHNLAVIADRLRMRIERVARRRLRREFGRFARVAAASPRSLERPTKDHRDRIQAILVEAYRLSILLGVQLAEDQLVESPKFRAVALERKQTDSTEALIDRITTEWIEQRSFMKATSIAESSRATAQTILEQSINAGLGERDTARALQRGIDGLSRQRSLTIARTETHGAVMNASNATAEDFGATEKEWVALEDSRTRETHKVADGQTVSLTAKFRVGSAMLRFPGDPDAGAPGETINCRCALAYQ